MSGYNYLKNLRLNPNFNYALELLNAIKRQQEPDEKNLSQLYPGEESNIRFLLERFYRHYRLNHPLREFTEKPGIILNKILVPPEPEFNALKKKLLARVAPSEADFNCLGKGRYNKAMRLVAVKSLKAGMTRKCGVPEVLHYFRTSYIVNKFGFDNDGGAFYNWIMFAHDVYENFPKLYGGHFDHGGLKSLQRISSRLIPPESNEYIRLLSNFYSIILKQIDELYKLSHTKIDRGSLLKSLNRLKPPTGFLTGYFNMLEDELDKTDLSGNVIHKAQEKAYSIYINELARRSSADNNLRLIQVKCIDIYDNCGGLLGRSDQEIIKTLLKLHMWCVTAFNLKSDWLPLNEFVTDTHNQGISMANGLILRDLLAPYYKQDYFVSGLRKISTLKQLLYVI